jgi:hypothetical protein
MRLPDDALGSAGRSSNRPKSRRKDDDGDVLSPHLPTLCRPCINERNLILTSSAGITFHKESCLRCREIVERS